jgi:hypothetical protein
MRMSEEYVICQTIYTAGPCVLIISADYLHTWISCINGLTKSIVQVYKFMPAVQPAKKQLYIEFCRDED